MDDAISRSTPTAAANHISALMLSAIGPAETPTPVVSRDILAAVLDVLATPTLLVDGTMSVLQVNAAATAVLASGTPLRLLGDKLVTVAESGYHLADAIRAAARGCPMHRSLILQASDKVSVAVWLRPLDQNLQTAGRIWHNGIVCLTLRALRTAPAVSTGLLRAHYRLTPRQAQIVVHLAQGASLDEVAAAMSIGMPTARSHLARCFEKTGTRRQTDLIGLALSLERPVLE